MASENESPVSAAPSAAGRTPPTVTENKLLLKAKEAAATCGKSVRTWRTWDAAGWIPRPVRIGRSTLWRADELREWISAGCPRREQWEARA
jgi:predicted DNA-binding transcriptional regulator AlpA